MAALPEEVRPYITAPAPPYEIQYPVVQYPEKVKSINFSKVQEYQGVLKGIKGQYLLFADQSVCNIRSNEGHVVRLQIQ